MDPVLGGLVSTGIGAAATVFVTFLAKRRPHGDRVDELERIQRLLEDYVFELRQWIADEKGPPPPLWPKELTHSKQRKE